ncbi:MAG: HAMP domain-containing histidine kinase, partial [Chitinophagaceae bacterium]
SNANELLEDLLTWAKAQFNAVNFNPEEIHDVSAHIAKSIHNITPMAEKKAIKIHQFIEEGLTLNADKGMLETVLRNLISNAVKFSERGGSISVNATAYDKGVKFSVADSGLGIPKDMMPQLFDKTSNYTTYGTAGEKGTGLGLNLCYDFVLKHGGLLWADSESGKGSIFYFTIPRI